MASHEANFQRMRGLLGGRSALLLVVGVVCCGGCGGGPPVELPAPDSGVFLTLEEQHQLSSDQLAEYCRMLEGELERLRGDIVLAEAMTDSLGRVLDGISAEHDSANQEARVLENELRRQRVMRRGVTRYQTRAGDTLMGLSSLFYGSAAEWRKIYDANREKIENPGEALPAGIQLAIPR